jgi:Ca2+-binding RTX toxin-like protein
MKNLIQLRASRAVWLAASAMAVAAAVIVAGPANATGPSFKQPRLKHGELRVKGTNTSETIALRLRAGEPGILEIDVGDDGSADFSFKRADIAEIAVKAGPGDDLVRMDESNGVFTDSIPTTIDGRLGDDRLAGGRGNETLLGGPGNDLIDGNGGNDVAFMDAGDDVFVWDPGDGSDIVEGQAGADTMAFNGAAAAEQFDLSANGNRLRFFRNVGAITMDTAGVEQVDVPALGGADLVTVNDLIGTDVSAVNVDLAGTLGGGTGDAQPDRVVVNATDADDTITVNGDAGGVKVSGLAVTIGILHSEAANDRLELNTLAGTDSVDSGGLAAGAIQLFVDGVLVP